MRRRGRKPDCRRSTSLLETRAWSAISPTGQRAPTLLARLGRRATADTAYNVTGLSLSSSEVIAERLELLRQLVPGLHRLAVIVRDDPGLDQKLQDIRSTAHRIGIEALMLQATAAKAVELAFARLRGDRAKAILCGLRPAGARQARPD